MSRVPIVHRLLAFLLLAAALPAPLLAQAANPALTARIQGINSEAAQSRKLIIAALDIDVRIHGTIAETEITTRFANAGQQILEGDFTLNMPAGSVVTGYALDVNGRMIDGVLADQRQARVAYEARVRQRIDPGLAEVDRANVFRTRVFPIFPGSGRTVRIRFATPFDPRIGYVLPLRDSEEIGAFSLDIEASGVARSPSVRLPNGGRLRWTSDGGVHRFSTSGRDVRLAGVLEVAPTEPQAAMLTSRSAAGEAFFEIADRTQRAPSGPAAPVRNVAVLWDRSLSRADDNLAEEISVLTQYLEQVRPGTISLILFSSSGAERVEIGSVSQLASRLRSVRYRGATSFAPLRAQNLAGTDACLLFSDGLVTIDRREAFAPGCPLFAISSARDADRAWLRSLARGAGGEAFDLGVREAGEVLTRMTRRVPRIVDVRSSSGAAIDFSLLDAGDAGWRIVGPAPASGNVVVRIAGLSGGVEQRVYSERTDAAEMNGAAAIWAAERVAMLAAREETGRDELVDFSRRYSVASPAVSFIVLETGRDYAMARIDPPATLPAELLDEYRMAREQMKRTETDERGGRLRRVLAQWQEMREWWANPTRPRARLQDQDPVGRGRGRPSPPPVVSLEAAPAPPPAPPPPPPQFSPPAPQEGTSPTVDVREQAIVTTGSRVSARGGSAGAAGSRGTIAVAPWSANRPYLAALEAAAPAEFERVFAEQQAEHGSLPAFWLDMADWSWRKGRRAEAVDLLLSALELPTRNSQTVSIVADRLLRYGEVDRAVLLLERLAASEDDRPQPRRSLALALAKRAERAPREQARADLARAVSLLTEVVMTPWSGAYDGIEMISLMELNRLIPRYRALGGGPLALDPRLIALLDVDLRVTIEWFSEATDVDLWVDEPGGERAIFHNPRTAIGGRLSNDMTQGYGPEEYLLRRAVPGAYQVRANVFAADRINPNGPQRVTARLIRDFGRPTEREEVVDIELLPGDQRRERQVGTVTVEPRPAQRR